MARTAMNSFEICNLLLKAFPDASVIKRDFRLRKDEAEALATVMNEIRKRDVRLARIHEPEKIARREKHF